MRESVRTQNLSWSYRYSSRIMHLLECMFIFEHCTALRWRVAHLGRFHYRALVHSVEGYYFTGTRSVRGDGACEGTARPRD